MHDATFQPVPESARAARDFVRHHLAASGISDPDPDLAVLLVSELATNATVRVGLAFVVWVDPSPPCIRVGVDDRGAVPSVLGRPQVSDMGGRGLAIVAELADRWGIEPTATGKRTWFQICA